MSLAFYVGEAAGAAAAAVANALGAVEALARAQEASRQGGAVEQLRQWTLDLILARQALERVQGEMHAAFTAPAPFPPGSPLPSTSAAPAEATAPPIWERAPNGLLVLMHPGLSRAWDEEEAQMGGAMIRMTIEIQQWEGRDGASLDLVATGIGEATEREKQLFSAAMEGMVNATRQVAVKSRTEYRESLRVEGGEAP